MIGRAFFAFALVAMIASCKKPSGLTNSDRVQLFCAQLALETEVAAESYRKVQTLPPDAWPALDGIESKEARLAIANPMLKDLYLCASVHVTTPAGDEAVNSFGKLAQTYGESEDPAAIAKSLETMAALLREIEKLPMND